MDKFYTDKNVRTWEFDCTSRTVPCVMYLKLKDRFDFMIGNNVNRHISEIDVKKAENQPREIYFLTVYSYHLKEEFVIRGNFNQLIDIVDSFIKNW
jgi:hypothetical protein